MSDFVLSAADGKMDNIYMVRPSRVFGSLPPVRKFLPLPSLALATVMAKDGSIVYASSGALYKGAIFGRDSLEVAEDLMRIKPALVHNILLTLGRLQGTSSRSENEEELGKIIHEYRTEAVDGRPLTGRALRILQELSEKWGGDMHTLAYYGSIDATPHFLRALHAYCRVHGDSILREPVTRRDGKQVTMQTVAEQATAWLQGKLDQSRSGLLEYKRTNPRGSLNHAWKDSDEFYVHENRERVNHEWPIASIEVQGLTYDALLAAAYFQPDKSDVHTARAHRLRDRMIELLWQSERHYFALGLDYADARPRIIQTATSNPASLLDTSIFESLPADIQEQYMRAVIERIMEPDFLTNAGVRSRALSASHVVPFWDYHGSYVTWPKETYDIAKGLRRQGLPRLSQQLENRLLNIILKTHDYPEFVYVDERGRVLPGPPRRLTLSRMPTIAGTNTPERIQAWTVSAVMAIIASRGRMRHQNIVQYDDQPWRSELEQQMLRRIPHVNLYINPIRLWLQYPTKRYRLTTPSAT